jgi:hypothetical protein
MNAYEALLSLSALLALGCGGDAVDVGHSQDRGWTDAPIENASATAPQAIYDSDEAVFGFALDDNTLYALIHHDRTFELVSCELDRCRSERTVLFSGPYLDQSGPHHTPLLISRGWLYWITGGGVSGLAACPITGCTQPRFVPTHVSSNLAGDGEGGVYFIDQEQSSVMHLAADGEAPERVQSFASGLGYNADIAAKEDYVYFGPDDQTISRFRRDGEGVVEAIATDEMLATFTVTADSIFYASQLLTGKIVKCPLAGCAQGSDTLVANQRWPEEVLVQGNEAFWLTNPRFSESLTHATLQSCVLPECASVHERVRDLPTTEIVDHQPQSPRFAVNGQSIVWMQSFRTDGSSLRRLAR